MRHRRQNSPAVTSSSGIAGIGAGIGDGARLRSQAGRQLQDNPFRLKDFGQFDLERRAPLPKIWPTQESIDSVEVNSDASEKWPSSGSVAYCPSPIARPRRRHCRTDRTGCGAVPDLPPTISAPKEELNAGFFILLHGCTTTLVCASTAFGALGRTAISTSRPKAFRNSNRRPTE